MALSDEEPRTRTWKRVVQRVARTVGLHVGRYPPVDSLAYHLRTLFRELSIDLVLDVGAHLGEFADSLRELGYAGEIISFEPVPESFANLVKARSADNKWSAQNVALGSTDGTLEMNIYAGSVFNSFLKPAEDGSKRFENVTQIVGTQKVAVKRLESIVDTILKTKPGARIFLKMDTQGYDLEVVRGAGKRIDNILALQTELAARATYAGMPTLPDALSELDRFGYEVTGIFPVAREMDHLRVIEFDCVMCRKPD